MDRTNRALLLAEDALAEIVRVEKALRALIKSSCDTVKGDAETAVQNVAQASADALAAAKNALDTANAARSAADAADVKIEDFKRKMNIKCLTGAANIKQTTFGSISVTGFTVAIFRYDGDFAPLKLNGVTVGPGTMKSPVVTVVPEGSGALVMTGKHLDAKLLLIGEFEVI